MLVAGARPKTVLAGWQPDEHRAEDGLVEESDFTLDHLLSSPSRTLAGPKDKITGGLERRRVEHNYWGSDGRVAS